MNDWKHFHKVVGIIFIVIGVILYPTPTPGTTLLILLGFVWILGKNRTLNFFKGIFSRKMFKFLKIKSIVKKI